jgi:hypothetical protein
MTEVVTYNQKAAHKKAVQNQYAREYYERNKEARKKYARKYYARKKKAKSGDVVDKLNANYFLILPIRAYSPWDRFTMTLRVAYKLLFNRFDYSA